MTSDTRPSSSGPPITWVDVARALSTLDPASSRWRARPAGLNRIHVDWASAVFEIESSNSDQENVKAWLRDIVPGLRVSDDGDAFLLDGPEGLKRLPIEFEVSDSTVAPVRVNLGAINGDVAFNRPALNDAPFERPVPVIACHSIKGGTGRTTSAIAVASIWQKREDKPILVVDADLEAPGLSYLVAETQLEACVSFEDLVVLAHAYPSRDKSVIVRWVAERLQTQRIGQLVVLPLRRALDELASSAIRAEHIASTDNPYTLADLLSLIAHEIGCAGVMVDLRAGLVPISAQLILDPAVPRIFCTSLANQSVKATGALISFVARELRKLAADQTPPLLIVNRIPSVFRDYGTDDRILEPVLEQIEESLVPDSDVEVDTTEPILDNGLELKPFFLTKVGEIADLQVPRTRWDDFAAQLETSGFVGQMHLSVSEWLDFVLPVIKPALQNEPKFGTQIIEETPQRRRDKLKQFAESMEFAESKNIINETPLVTGALRAFAKEGRTPIVVSEGAKGTGKTLTARYFISKATWRNAMEQLHQGTTSFDAELVPVVSSTVGSSNYILEVDERRRGASSALGFSTPQKATQTKDILVSAIATQRTQSQWTQLWLDVIAWSVGLDTGQAGAGERLVSRLRDNKQHMIAVIEGIEEIRPTTQDNSFLAMLGSLLVDLPARLRTEQDRPLGIIVFARRDTVDLGVPQNVGQFRQQYRDFSLTWDEPDVLELAAWLATKSGALNIWEPGFASRDKRKQEQFLVPLWGWKLGPDDRDGKRTQEAYTANWVLAVLSDLQGRLTARDLVRFIKEASAISVTPQDQAQYSGRLLLPSALRKAIGPTSAAKVEEIQEEVPELKAIFGKIRQNKNAVKAPISQDKIREMHISSDDITLLQTHGVILDESPPYEVPELFRIGLGLAHGGARRNVIGIMRRAKERSGAR